MTARTLEGTTMTAETLEGTTMAAGISGSGHSMVRMEFRSSVHVLKRFHKAERLNGVGQ